VNLGGRGREARPLPQHRTAPGEVCCSYATTVTGLEPVVKVRGLVLNPCFDFGSLPESEDIIAANVGPIPFCCMYGEFSMC